MTSLKKEIIVRQIAKDLYLREDVVEEVLDRFVDIAIEEIVNKGEFRVHRLLSVSVSDYKAYRAGKGDVPAHQRLRVRLSDGIHSLFKLRMGKFNGDTSTITRDNWRDFLGSNLQKKRTLNKALSPNSNEDLYNPLLDED